MAKQSPKRNSVKKKAPAKKVPTKKPATKKSNTKDCDGGVCPINKPKKDQTTQAPDTYTTHDSIWSRLSRLFGFVP